MQPPRFSAKPPFRQEGIMGTLSIKVAVFLLPFIFQIVEVVHATEPYDFTRAAIRSLQLASVARERLLHEERQLHAQKGSMPNLLAGMTSIRTTVLRLEEACGQVRPYMESKNEFIKRSAEAYVVAYRSIIDSFENKLNLLEKLGNMSPEQFLSSYGTIQKESSEYLVQADEGWRLLIFASIAATHCLIDQNRIQNGKFGYLAIDKKEREELLRELRSSFGVKIQEGPKPGMYPLEGSAALLWKVLTDKWKAADAK
jgi:hypothetical protein